MTVRITIVGLGQIGGSIGLALAARQELFERIGYDRDQGVARKAQKIGAVDRVSANLPAAVRDADIILLSLPMDQIQETLAYIAMDLKEDAVVMDTGPVKEVVAAWAADLLPEKRYYLGLTPVLNPAYLHSMDSGLDAARADLFTKGMLAIVSPPGTPSEAIKLAADLTRLLGADLMFADPVEMDSVMAATYTLPQLLSVALLNATIDRPGWREARKVAGRAYAEVTSSSALLSEPRTLAKSALLNRENTLRALDGVIAALQALRGDLETGDETMLEERLERARSGRALWWQQRQAGNWMAEEDADLMSAAPSSSEVFGRLLGLRRKKKEK